MATPEVISRTFRDPEEDLRIIRERLGKPAFKDQKEGRSKTMRFVSSIISATFQNRNRRNIQEWMSEIVDNKRKEQLQITPAYLSSQACFSVSRDMQRRVLLGLNAYKKEDRPIDIAVLDVIKGFQQVLAVVNAIYDSSRNNIEFGLLRRLDPKGFTCAEEQAKIWGSSLQAPDGFIQSYEDAKLIADGAKLAVKAYKKMYPIAQKALSSRS